LEGVGWWTKPTAAQPTVTIDSTGHFTAPVATGGNDPLATIYDAALLPAGTTPTQALGSGPVPINPTALATTAYERYPASLSFAGRSWAAKGTYGAAGPGANYFSASNSDVWVDGAGMHLSVHNHDGHWWSTEVILPEHLGYGTYAFKTQYAANSLDPNLTFGAFTWDPYGSDSRIPAWPYREIDFEDSRWGNAGDPTNTQMVVQPYTTNPPHRYTIPAGNITLTRFFKWQPGSIQFVTLLGDRSPSNYSPQDMLQDWTYTENVSAGKLVPTPATEMFHFNLWLNNGTAPSNGQPAEVLITDFSFIGPGDANLDGKVDINDLSKVLTNYDRTGTTWSDGDFDGNGTVNINDLSRVLTSYDKSLGSSAAAIHAVPEPAGLVLLALATCVGLPALACRRLKDSGSRQAAKDRTE
jgi:hypothetical protein